MRLNRSKVVKNEKSQVEHKAEQNCGQTITLMAQVNEEKWGSV